MLKHRVQRTPLRLQAKVSRWQIKQAIDADTTLPRFIRLAILRLWWHGGNHGVAFPFQSTVAKAVGCTRRTVIRAVAVAEANGWLRVERRGRRSAEYIWAWSGRFDAPEMSQGMSPQEAATPYIPEKNLNCVAHNPALEAIAAAELAAEGTCKQSLQVQSVNVTRGAYYGREDFRSNTGQLPPLKLAVGRRSILMEAGRGGAGHMHIAHL